MSATVFNDLDAKSAPPCFHWKSDATQDSVSHLFPCPLEYRRDRRGLEEQRAWLAMPAHAFTPIRGRIDRWCFSSARLNNRLNDPEEREVLVHLSPEGIEAMEKGEELPVIVYLAPFTGSGPQRAGWKAFAETLPQRHERLVASAAMKPVILVMPDTFTSLGGNQYVDSPVTGQWSTWLAEDLKKELTRRYLTNGNFGLVGKSSGGYGAMVNAMLHPEAWHAIASHSGDIGFDLMYGGTWGETITHLASHASGEAYVRNIAASPSMRSADFHALMMCALAASYDPREANDTDDIGVCLPVDFETCQVDQDAWARWLAFDPLNMVEQHHQALKGLSLCFIDCGNADQYNIHYGTRRFAKRLQELNVPHHYEEFAGTHSGIDHRLDVSLPLLSTALRSN